MEIMNILIEFFGIDLSFETFPELMQSMLLIFCAVIVVVYTIRTLADMNVRISNIK